MKVAKAEAGRIQDRFKDARRNGEDLVGEAGKAMSEALPGMLGSRLGGLMNKSTSWFGGSDGRPSDGHLDRAPLATYMAGPANVPPLVPVPGHPAHSAVPGGAAFSPLAQAVASLPSAPPPIQRAPQAVASVAPIAAPVASVQQNFACSAPPAPLLPAPALTPARMVAVSASLPPTPLASTSEDDVAMRQHFTAIERLVAMGLSPQAARAALRHMDEWLTSKAGISDMVRSEASAREAGEPIMHMGDHVRLEGLVKNQAANGKMAVLSTYVAESQRWKVALNDGKSYLLQPKFLVPVALKPTAYLQQLEEVEATTAEPPQNSSASTVAEKQISQDAHQGSADIERRKSERIEEETTRQLREEEMKKQQDDLLRREEDLIRNEELLNTERVEMRRGRASLAMVQAHVASMLEKSENGGELKEHRMDDDDDGAEDITHQPSEQSVSNVSDDESPCNEDGEEDDVWDMDWSAMASPSPTKGEGVCLDQSDFSQLTQALVEDATEAAAPASVSTIPSLHSTAAGDSSNRSLSPVRPMLEISADLPAASEVASLGGLPKSPEDAEELNRILEERHRLAELHNGEDLTNVRRPILPKESMPGAHPALAEKLEARAHKLKMEENQRHLESTEAEQRTVEEEAF